MYTPTAWQILTKMGSERYPHWQMTGLYIRNIKSRRTGGQSNPHKWLVLEWLGSSEVLRSLRHDLRAQSQGYHTTDLLEERGIERGSTRDLPRKNERGPLRQWDEHWNRFKGNAGEPLRDGVEHILTSPSRIDTILIWNELNWTSPPPTPRSRDRQREADWDGASVGWVKPQYCKYASWQSSNKPSNERGTQTYCTRKLGKALSRMAGGQNWVRASHSRKQQRIARSHSIHWWLGHPKLIRVGLHCQ